MNNAGISVGDKGPLDQTPQEAVANFDNVIGTNVKGCWFMARAVSQLMRKHNHGGSIINVASILGFRVFPWQVEYTMSKAAVLHMTHSLALDLARHQIRVNSLAPGFFLSDINRKLFEKQAGQPDKSHVGAKMTKNIPMRRLGEYRELDGALLLLASDKAGSYMTGSTLVVDGGHMHSSL